MFTTKTTHPMGVTIPPQLQAQVETSARAIEVSALFEDAVLDVRHLDNPGAGKLSGLTKGALGLGGIALGSFFLLFGSSYLQVKHEKESAELASSTSQSSRSSGRSTDWAAMGFLFLGASALTYGLWRAGTERGDREFTIGSGAKATFKTSGDGLPVEEFPLVRSTGSTFEIVLTPAMRGEVQVDGATQSLQEWAAAGRLFPSDTLSGALCGPIPGGARFVIEHGNNTFLVSSVAAPRRYPVPLRVDWGQQAYTGFVLAGAAAFLGLILAVPPDPRSLSIDGFTNAQIARFLVKPQETPQEELPTWLTQQPKSEMPKQDRGKAAKGESGKSGRPDAPKVASKVMVQGPKDTLDKKIAAGVAAQVAKDHGVLGMLTQHRGLMSSILSKDSALGSDAKDALGNLMGVAEADGYGNNGLGFVGVRNGGGGTGEGTIGIGPLGRIGGPGGNGSCVGALCRPGGPALRQHRTTGPEVTISPAEVKGSLDKELIRRVIRRHLPEVKFCYERELTRNNTLEGRVQIHFIIGTTGAVTASMVQSSTLQNSTAEQCIAGAVRRWEFPKPQFGIVDVSYPFVLKAAAGE
jgi:hypothetical protein